MTMPEMELSAGTIEYGDTGGNRPVVVLLHGLLMDASLWDQTVSELAAHHRCITPILPLGAHRQPMVPDADLSLPAIAGLVGELLDRLDLHDVTLVGNDTGGALAQLLMAERHPRIGRVVLASCDAFDNFPPGLTGRTLVRTGKVTPTLFGFFMQQLRVRFVRRLPLAFGWLTKRGDAVTAGWIRPVLAQSRIRRDAVKVLRAIGRDRTLLSVTAERLQDYPAPALVVWAAADRVMPAEHGRRLAELLPDARLVEVEDSYTLLPLDQPIEFARLIREFVAVVRTA